MPWCVLKYCTNNSRNVTKCKGITFHRFPRPNCENREKWIKFVQNNRSEYNWLPTEHTYICSLHFRDEDLYETKNGRRFLKKSAVPYDDVILPLTISDPDAMEPMNLSISDSESFFDNPKQSCLKEKLKNITADKEKLIVKIKKIKKQNKYLKKKCGYLTNLVTTLKSKINNMETPEKNVG